MGLSGRAENQTNFICSKYCSKILSVYLFQNIVESSPDESSISVNTGIPNTTNKKIIFSMFFDGRLAVGLKYFIPADAVFHLQVFCHD